MSTTTRVRTRSASNADLVDHKVLGAVEKENRSKNRKKGKNLEKKQPAINVGEVAWDRLFAEGSFELPPTKFMDKVKAALTDEDFEHIKRRFCTPSKMKRITSAVAVIHPFLRPPTKYMPS